MNDERALRGGISSAGRVVRVGNEVRRPTTPSTPTVHALLRHLRSVGFEGAPEPIGIDSDGRQRLSFVHGEVPHPPYPAWSLSERALASTAVLLRRFHDATVNFAPPPDATWSNELADAVPGDVICHNDVRPENTVFRHVNAIAFLDFDFAAPGTRLHDLAHCAVVFVPFDAPGYGPRNGKDRLDPFARLRLLADAYGLTPGRRELVEVIGRRIAAGSNFVQRRVAAGDPTFTELWSDRRYRNRYKARERWFVRNRERFLSTVG